MEAAMINNYCVATSSEYQRMPVRRQPSVH